MNSADAPNRSPICLFARTARDKCPQCEKVLAELETIDDEAEAMDVDFVRVNDAKVARAYDIETFPAVIFFRKKFPQYYVGDLMDEDAVS